MDHTPWIWALGSVALISAISLIGVVALSLNTQKLRKFLIYIVSFSAGAFFGDAFIHLLPEAVEEYGFGIEISFAILAGILASFIVEKFIHWHHCHHGMEEDHPHPFAIMNLFGDGVHNFIDGLVIGASYLVSIPVGIATTLAVLFHEIPQEIGDFGILLHGGFSKGKAILFNFLTALTAIAGTITAIVLATRIEGIAMYLIPFAVGNFIYVAAADLIPELHKEKNMKKSLIQLGFFIMGIAVMWALLFLEIGNGH